MKIATVTYKSDTGWSEPLPDLDSKNTMVLVFGAPEFMEKDQPFQELKQKYSTAVIAGCSTAGEIYNDMIYDNSLIVSITKFQNTDIRLHTIPVISAEDSFDAGKQVAEGLTADDLQSVLVLTDGLLINGTDFAKGANSMLNEKILVTGGLAGDGGNFKKTWILVDGMPQTGYTCGIGFYGDKVKVDHGSKGGWKPFGPDRVITKSENNVLYELDGKPALELYKGYLGDMADGLPATGLRYPLLLTDEKTGKKLVRTILATDEEAQSLTFAGDIPSGNRAQLMFATLDNLIDGAEQAAGMLEIDNTIENNVLAIAISCVGRRMIMEEEPGAELEATQDLLPANTQQVGFYSYGELSPYVKNGNCDLHNQTMTLTTIYEQ